MTTTTLLTTRSEPAAPAETSYTNAVYICRHASGTIIYVGVSLRAMERLAQHSETKEWFAHVSRVDIERYPTRLAALNRERHLIQLHAPGFNILHVDRTAAFIHFFQTRAQETRVELMERLLHCLKPKHKAEVLKLCLQQVDEDTEALLKRSEEAKP